MNDTDVETFLFYNHTSCELLPATCWRWIWKKQRKKRRNQLHQSRIYEFMKWNLNCRARKFIKSHFGFWKTGCKSLGKLVGNDRNQFKRCSEEYSRKQTGMTKNGVRKSQWVGPKNVWSLSVACCMYELKKNEFFWSRMNGNFKRGNELFQKCVSRTDWALFLSRVDNGKWLLYHLLYEKVLPSSQCYVDNLMLCLIVRNAYFRFLN
jgi:hypothetical protein